MKILSCRVNDFSSKKKEFFCLKKFSSLLLEITAIIDSIVTKNNIVDFIIILRI